jgi:hypothetical protein
MVSWETVQRPKTKDGLGTGVINLLIAALSWLASCSLHLHAVAVPAVDDIILHRWHGLGHSILWHGLQATQYH